jgi:light-regulated signal transduction histidine kinase (bacteriophytochrome)
MSMLIKALLDFSRLGRNRKLLFIDCHKIVADVIADLKTIIETSNTTIHIGELPKLNVYETEIRQLFQNLITNAIKFVRKSVAPKIEIQATREGDKWLFTVKDNGIGIAPVHYERVFEIFQRLHTNNEYEGNGIGLANCKKIIELHQGEIWIESGVGNGTTIKFSIPDLEL